MEERPAYAFPALAEFSTVQIITEPNTLYRCVFCKRPDVDELHIGPLYFLPEADVRTHYFCMLFSAGLEQQGEDCEGILGFLPEDISKEVRRAQRLKCLYCGVKGASIGCNTSRCKASFHFPCGLANEANFQFVQNFLSFCKNHSQCPERELPLGEPECPICLISIKSPEKPVISSCCKSAIFHKDCIQKHALSSGYFYKCPICNCPDNFSCDTKLQGIYVPAQDASWERVPNAYQDLYVQYGHCDVEICECPRGRDYGANKGNWLLARCRVCGSAGTHRQCGKLTTIADWICAPCEKVEARRERKRKLAMKLQKVEEDSSPGEDITTDNFQTIQEESKPTENQTNNQLKTVQEDEIPIKKNTAIASTKSKTVTFADEVKTNTTELKPIKQKKSNTTSTKRKSNHAAASASNSNASSKSKANTDLLPPPSPKRVKTVEIADVEVECLEEEDDENEEEEVEHEEVDLGKLHVLANCSDFFPYNRETKKKLAQEADSFPDWRGLYLQVQLVNIFFDAANVPETPVKEKRKKASKGAKTKLIPIPTGAVTGESESKGKPQIATITNVSKHKIRTPKRTRRKRGNNWKRGVVKQKKKATSVKAKSTAISEKSVSQPNSSNAMEKEKQPTASQAILEGIRRSHESLLQFKQDKATVKESDDLSVTKDEKRKRNGLNMTTDDTIVERKSKKRSHEKAFTSETKNEDKTTENGSKNNTGSFSSCPGTCSKNLSQEISHGTSIDNEKNAESSVSSGFGSQLSPECNGNSHQNSSFIIPADSPAVVKVEVDDTNLQTQNDADDTMCNVEPSKRPNLAEEIQQSARGIANELLRLSDRSLANEKLWILEKSCPHLFQKNSKT